MPGVCVPEKCVLTPSVCVQFPFLPLSMTLLRDCNSSSRFLAVSPSVADPGTSRHTFFFTFHLALISPISKGRCVCARVSTGRLWKQGAAIRRNAILIHQRCNNQRRTACKILRSQRSVETNCLQTMSGRDEHRWLAVSVQCTSELVKAFLDQTHLYFQRPSCICIPYLIHP